MTLPPPGGRDWRFHMLAAAYLVLVVAVGVYVWGRRPGPAAPASATTVAPSADPPVATVNGEPISRSMLETALDDYEGQRITRRLIRETAILQDAVKENVTLDDADSRARLEVLTHQIPDGSQLALLDRSLRARMLLRKLVLKRVSDGELRHWYEAFKDELTRYEVYDILAQSAAHARVIAGALKDTPFEEVAARFSRDLQSRPQGGRCGFLSLSEVEEAFGGAARQDVLQLSPGRVVGPIACPAGVLFLKVGRVHSTYGDLKPDIENLVVDARAQALAYTLVAHAQVTWTGRGGSVANLPAATPESGAVFAPVPSAVKAPPSIFAPPPKVKVDRNHNVFAPPR
ncbi:MAG TPA: peptidylprolyl isomerase [Candidatus Xenobia bacterium]